MKIRWKNGLVILFDGEQVYPPRKPPYWQTGFAVTLSLALPAIYGGFHPAGPVRHFLLAALTFAAAYAVSSIAIIAFYWLKWRKRS